MAEDLLLPAGTRLLHIGPPKTGTTAIQGALKLRRSAMAAHGVVYPGKERQHSLAARAVLGTPGPKGDPPVDPRSWDRLVRQVTAAGNRRVVLSSEVFAKAGRPAVRRVVEGFGGPRVHVVVTLRPLVRILPSQWQQAVRQTLRDAYPDWLADVLGRPPYDRRPPSYTHAFWQRHRHDLLVERWASVVGQERLTVVVLDESDRAMLPRTFEQLLGLPDGLLESAKSTNPSLTYGEVELVRHVNEEFHLRGWTDEQHRALVRTGLVRHLQHSERPLLDDQKIVTPRWAADRAAEIGAAQTQRIAASGVRVVGDLATLAEAPTAPGAEEATTTPRAVVPSVAVTHAVVGTILSAAERGSPVVAEATHTDGRPRRRTMSGLRARLRAAFPGGGRRTRPLERDHRTGRAT